MRVRRNSWRSPIPFFQQVRVMDLSALTNDQVAVLGCFGALAACGLVAAITFHVGPAGKKSLESQPTRLKINRPVQEETHSDETRKAA